MSIIDTLRNHLFETNENGTNVAIDLAATNINRGRDHGLQPYVAYRKFCGLSVPKTFSDLADCSMNSTIISQLMSVYE